MKPQPAPAPTPKDEEAQWWKDDAARVNAMGEQARKMGITRPLGAGPPPKLNPDGSLAGDDETMPPDEQDGNKGKE